jgi:hypothetical protein
MGQKWVGTWTPEVARLAEMARSVGVLPLSWMYAVPESWIDAGHDPAGVVWAFPDRSIQTGEPFDVRRWAYWQPILGDL